MNQKTAAAMFRYPLLPLILLASLLGVTVLSAAGAKSRQALPVGEYAGWVSWYGPSSGVTFDLSRCQTMQMGDADGDGRDDLICPYDYGGSETRTFVQYSQGNAFSAWTSQQPVAQVNFDVNRCRPLVPGDVNNDGRIDLICPYDYGDAKTRTFVQLATDTVYTQWQDASPTEGPGVFDLNRCVSLQTGDVNGDHRTDLICAYDYGGGKTITFVQYAAGAAAYSAWISASETAPDGLYLDRCQPLLSGDFNGDGLTDLACPREVAPAVTDTLVQLAGNGGFRVWSYGHYSQGGFAISRCRPTSVGRIKSTIFVTAEEQDDLICPYDYGDNRTKTFVQYSLPLFDSDGMTAWISQEAQQRSNFDLNRCRPLVAGDLNSDGLTDLICPYDYGSAITRTFVQLSTESGYIPWLVASPSSGPGGFDLNLCRTLKGGDVNGDGRTDLVCPYDYGDGKTATFVQLPHIFEVALPVVIR